MNCDNQGKSNSGLNNVSKAPSESAKDFIAEKDAQEDPNDKNEDQEYNPGSSDEETFPHLFWENQDLVSARHFCSLVE